MENCDLIPSYLPVVLMCGTNSALKTSLPWNNLKDNARVKLQALVYDILPSTKVPESGAGSVR